ncbi:MAG: sigma-70 family RNA polymerase sigma factor, partial [Lachnospiraceae bacterium]|nr:sigma-70 family RNA polymerase sigma factor [Lachnospiraceae bacterium]
MKSYDRDLLPKGEIKVNTEVNTEVNIEESIDASAFEQALALRATERDAEAERELFDLYRPRIGKYIANQAEHLPGTEKEDLVQEGMIGLMQAIHDYDAAKNPNFAAFAWLCIKRQILNAKEKLFRLKNQPLNSYISIDAEGDEDEMHLDEVIGQGDLNPEFLFLQTEKAENLRQEIRRQLTPLERQT